MNVMEVDVFSIPDDEFAVPAKWKIKQDRTTLNEETVAAFH
jgi:hypothetical protein